MRTYSGFLLFQDVLDYLPQTNLLLYTFGQALTHPVVKVVSEDCQTTNGNLAQITYELEGRIELATGTPINETRILYLVGLGIYRVGIRSLDSCTAVGGICRACYHGTFLDLTAPAIGSNVTIQPEYNYKTDVIRGTGGTTVFSLSQDPSLYTKVLVVENGAVLTSGYTINGTTLTMAVAPGLGVNVIVRYYIQTTQPFIGYMAETYSGSLLGIKPLPTQPIHIRPSLLASTLTETQLDMCKDELERAFPLITPTYIDYINTVSDKVERGIYIATMYGIYSNVS